MSEFSERLKKARIDAGKTQEEMGLLLEMNWRSYQSYERGLSEPKFKNLKKICIILNVSSDYLLSLKNR